MPRRYHTTGRPFNRDLMHMVSRDRAAVVAHEALASINALRPEEQAAAVAVLFYGMTKRFGLTPEEHYHLGRKLLTDPQTFHKKGNSQMEALEAYFDLQNSGRIEITA